MRNAPEPSKPATSAQVILLRTSQYALSGRKALPGPRVGGDIPLIVAIPGGSYTSAYFDVPDYSLMQRSAALQIPIMALDRPGYGESTPFPPPRATIISNAERLDDAIGRIWESLEIRPAGVVLIGHSIGGAIALSIAARRPGWPLLGVAVSGVGLTPPPGSAAAWAAIPDGPLIDVPLAAKDAAMFGPSWTIGADMPGGSRLADAPAPRAEVVDMNTGWPGRLREVAARIVVPVHYRQGEFDRLWITNQDEIDTFARAFTAAPTIDAGLYPSAGHCIDLHLLGAAFQLEQLAFALRCSVRRK